MGQTKTIQNDRDKVRKAAYDTMKLARNTLVIHLRFMDMAISRLRWRELEEGTFTVDGEEIGYDPTHVLRLYLGEKEQVSRAYLHMVLHCVFRHFLIGSLIDEQLWNLACDIAVENMISELGIRAIYTSRDAAQNKVFTNLKTEMGKLTAEKIYHYLRQNERLQMDLKSLEMLFKVDDHSIWYRNNQGSNLDIQQQTDESENPDQTDNDKSSGSVQTNRNADKRNRELESMWKDISERLQTDLETISKLRGDSAGSMMQNLAAVNREKYDYTDFLKRFAVLNETVRINDEEFDYLFYTYGMQMFAPRKMPLIEPLEYREVKQIREFVIAIDTSGSVSGSLVQQFIQKTYNILLSTESFSSKINLHIIQCDSKIQEHVKITSCDEFKQYIRRMEIRGLGGTDFRPVFEIVDEMIKMHEFSNLRGLIYFTDGYGEFPKRKPTYRTAFVFVEDDLAAVPAIPPWAIRLVLSKEEIEETV